MRQLMMALLGLTLIFSSGVVSAENAKEETIKIGFSGDLSGPVASCGLTNLYGLEYEVRKINKNGGLLGHQIEIIKEDDKCDPALGLSTAGKLVGDGVKVVFGHSCSEPTAKALSVYNNEVILMSSSATESSLTEDGKNPYFFRTIINDKVQVALQVNFIKNNSYQKVAILYDKSGYGKDLANRAKALFDDDKNGIQQVVLFGGVTAGPSSYDGAVSKLKEVEADVLLWGGYYMGAATLIKKMRAEEVPTIMVGADNLQNSQYLKLAGEAAEGTFFVGLLDLFMDNTTASPAVEAALADYHKQYKTEATERCFFQGIAAAQALFAAIEKAGSATDLEAIRKNLQNDTVETIMGEVHFDAKGDIIGVQAVMYEVKDGEFVKIEM